MFGNRSNKDIRVYHHGQYAGCDMDGTFGHAAQVEQQVKNDPDKILDDHHSPLTPDKYLRLRVEPMINFYQGRLPQYYRLRISYEVLLTLGSLSGTVLAFFRVDEWAAITTAVTTMVTAWSVFHRTKDKLARYTNTIEKTQSVVLWWEALTSHNVTSDIDTLVTQCEQMFEREREAWASTSMTMTQLQAQGEEGSSKGNRGGHNEGHDSNV